MDQAFGIFPYRAIAALVFSFPRNSFHQSSLLRIPAIVFRMCRIFPRMPFIKEVIFLHNAPGSPMILVSISRIRVNKTGSWLLPDSVLTDSEVSPSITSGTSSATSSVFAASGAFFSLTVILTTSVIFSPAFPLTAPGELVPAVLLFSWILLRSLLLFFQLLVPLFSHAAVLIPLPGFPLLPLSFPMTSPGLRACSFFLFAGLFLVICGSLSTIGNRLPALCASLPAASLPPALASAPSSRLAPLSKSIQPPSDLIQ